jgi:Transmembrane secretion effector
VAFENFRSKFNPLLAFPRLGGVLADRVPRARVLYGTQALAMLLATLLAILTLTGPVEPWYILVLSFLSASILAFDGPARQALLPDLVSSDNLMSAMSYNGWSFNAAILIGPSLAAALVPVIGLAGAFALNAGSYGAVQVALSLLRVKEGHVSLGRARENLLKGLRYVGRSPVILALVLLFCMGALLTAFSTVVSTLLQRTAHQDLRGRVMSVYTLSWQGLEIWGSWSLVASQPSGPLRRRFLWQLPRWGWYWSVWPR